MIRSIASPDIDAPAVNASCPVHGPYRSHFWEMHHPRNDPTRIWTGCPVCVRQHAQRRHGYGSPDLKEVHRPSV